MWGHLAILVVVGVWYPQVQGNFMMPPAPYITDLKGEPCRDNQTCEARYAHSFCKSSSNPDNSCHCKPGFVSSSDRTRCLASDVRLGGSCEENQQCSFWETSTAVCLPGSGICDCIPGFIPSDDLTQCLKIINILGTHSCQEDAQCQLGKPGKLSRCSKRSPSSSDDFRVCKCTEDAVNAAKENKCYPVAELPGDECAIQAQCTKRLKHSRCIDNQCECTHGYHPKQVNGKTICSPASETVPIFV